MVKSKRCKENDKKLKKFLKDAKDKYIWIRNIICKDKWE